MSCNYYNGKCVFLNGKVKEEGCIACPIKRAYSKGVIDTKKDYERPHGKWEWKSPTPKTIMTPHCNNCGHMNEFLIETNFCPNCGAPMTEEAFRKYNGLKEGETE